MESEDRVKVLLGECVGNGSTRGLPGWMWKPVGLEGKQFFKKIFSGKSYLMFKEISRTTLFPSVVSIYRQPVVSLLYALK